MENWTVLKVGLAANLIMLGLSTVAFAKDKLLVVSSYHDSYQWDIDCKEGLIEKLGDRFEMEWFYMDTKRLPKDKHQERGEEAWAKYQQYKPKMVVMSDDAAMEFLAPKFETEGKTPVIYLGVNRNPRDYYKEGKNITGILERPHFNRSIAEVKNILEYNKQQIKKILVLFDTDRTSVAAVEQAFEGKHRAIIQGIEVEVKLIGKLGDWKNEISSLEKNGYDALIIGLYQTIKDESNKPVTPDNILTWTSANVKKPSFAFWSFTVGKDMSIGGLVLYGKEQGLEAGKMVLEVVGGSDITKIRPRIAEKGQFLYSKSELKKWHLELPPSLLAEAKFKE